MNKKFYYYVGLKIDKVLLYNFGDNYDYPYSQYKIEVYFENGSILENNFTRFNWDSEMREYYDWGFDDKEGGLYQYINDEWIQLENWD